MPAHQVLPITGLHYRGTLSIKKSWLKILVGKRNQSLEQNLVTFYRLIFEKLMKMHFAFFSNQVLFEIKICINN